MHRSPLGSIAIGVAALLVVALTSCGNLGGDDPYTDTLQRFRDAGGLKNKIIKLPGGDRFSVGSPDGHDLVVQRYDADSKAWSPPKTVATDRQWTHEVRVAHERDTVAISADYWHEQVLGEDYSPDHSVGVVCAGLDCSRAHTFAITTFAEISADGSFVSFYDTAGFMTWSGGELSRERVTGLPSAQYEAYMAADASFRAVTGTRAGDGCRWTLSTTAPRDLHFTPQATSGVYPTEDPTCRPLAEDLGAQRVGAWVEPISGYVEFARDGEGWRELPQPVNHQAVVDTGGRSSIAPVFQRGRGLNDQYAVVYSPDGHRIMAQWAFSKSSRWSKPVTVLTTDDDTPCRSASFVRGDGGNDLWVAVRCWSGGPDAGLDQATPSDETVVMVSQNSGTVWRAVQVHRAGRIAAFMGGPLLVAGHPSVVIDEERDRTEVRLPMEDPAHDALSVYHDKLVTRIRVLPRAAACVAEVQFAQLEDQAWGPAAATTLPGVRRTAAGRCPDADLSWSREGQIATIDAKRWVVTHGTGQLRPAKR